MRSRRLIVVTPEGERELLFIGRLTVGRAPDCDISLGDTKASRRHAEFDASGPVPRVTDLGSRNGILVNGRKVGGAELSPGDVVTVGDARIRFEEVAPAAVPEPQPVAPALDDRTAVLSRPAAPPPPRAAAPADVPSEAGVEAGVGASAPPDDRRAAPPDDRTAVLPRPVAAPPTARSGAGNAGVIATSEVAVGQPAPTVPPPLAPPSRPGPAVSTPPAPSAVAVAPLEEPRRPLSAPIVSPPQVGTTTAVAPSGPRFSWAGLLVILCILLGGLGVLLGALPLLAATASTIDALSNRQARTLGGWLSTAVDDGGAVDERIVDAVLSQTGVLNAVVLDAGTGRAIAPRRMIGRAFPELPSAGSAWRNLSSATVTTSDNVIDALVPAPGGARGYVAWVRYERPSGREGAVAVVVALLSTLIFAVLVSILIKRHTGATLQHFTRLVELVVSGASPKVLQGTTLMPGLERLPGVVSYLMEQRSSAPLVAGGTLPESGPVAAVRAADGPPWLVVTPSLVVASASPVGPATGAPQWATAVSRHLLDVLGEPDQRNAVVQGLGALGMEAGAEVVVPVPGIEGASASLRREPSGNVRVTLGTP